MNLENKKSPKAQRPFCWQRLGLTAASLVAGLVIALATIYTANQLHQPATTPASANTGPLSYLLNTGPQAEPMGQGCHNADSATTTADGGRCSVYKRTNSCLSNGEALCAADLETARIAWAYFENNYNPKTGLYNSANQYHSTTMWDTGSAIAATIAAKDFGFITRKEFDDRIMAMYKTLNTMPLFNSEAPNKAYNTKTGKMVNYLNKETPKGIGVSILDLGRLASWLNTLQCMHPKHSYSAKKTIERWDLSRLLKNGQMYGLALNEVTQKIDVLQEGRLGYEQYVGKVFRNLGFDMSVSATYNNKHKSEVEIMGVPIAYDRRDPREFGANNYVITESFTMDTTENGFDGENRKLLRDIFDVQQERWKRTGIVTAITEDNIDQKPWFLYNSIFNAGIPWSTINPAGKRFNNLKTVSTKAAFAMATLYPEEAYSRVLMDTIASAYDPKKGWYSGIYESGIGYNKATTANTNGNILATLLYKKYGSLYPLCNSCKRMLQLDSEIINENKNKQCTVCEVSTTDRQSTSSPTQYAGKKQE